jgi:hypothetical protein
MTTSYRWFLEGLVQADPGGVDPVVTAFAAVTFAATIATILTTLTWLDGTTKWDTRLIIVLLAVVCATQSNTP